MTLRKTIPTKLTQLDKIIHCADIHIRLYKRHAEYREVFATFYDSIRSQNLTNTAIVVAGDVVHAKTDMSPEMVNLTSEFLKQLADLAPTILIAGNHDLNLANPNRLDALSPIVDNLQHENLYYLKDSGVYEFANVEFALFAVDDGPEDWPSATALTDGKAKIALFHGPVNLAQTDVGYTVAGKITVDTFGGYDMVLLGDIHRTQILQEYGGPGTPEIFYPGSLIQQNHGESLVGHGYGIWDVPTRSVETYVEVPNSYGYHTIRLLDNTMPDISNLPDNLRLRILAGDVDVSVVKKLQASIRRKYNVVECTVNKLPRQKNLVTGTSTNILDNIHDITTQNTLITEFIDAHQPGVDDSVIDKILEINTKLNAFIGEDELPKNISWKPIYLTFDNLFSYGEGNVINFEDMTGLYGVFSPNATGKTSAFDAMCFALYDKTPRAFKGSHIMNTRKDTFSCELTIDIESTRYMIERTGTRKKNGEVKVDVNFFKIDGDQKISLNGEDRRDTNGAIRSYVGTYEDFILTALSVQNQNSLFIDTGQSDRKDLLSQFIGLTVFDRLFNLAADEIKEVAGALKSFRKDDFTQNLANIQTEQDQVQREYDMLEANILNLTNKSNDLDENIKQLFLQKTPNIVVIDIEPIKERLEQHKIDLDTLSVRLNEEKIKADESQTEITKFATSHKHKRSEDELEKLDAEYIAASTAYQKMQAEINILHAKAQGKKEQLDKLKAHKYDPDCEYCVNSVFVKEAATVSAEYTSLMCQIDDRVVKMGGATEYLSVRESAHTELIELRKDVEMLRKMKDDREIILHEYKRLSESELQKTQAINDLYTIVAQYESNQNLIEQNKILESKILATTDIKVAVDKDIQQMNISLRDKDRQLTILRAKKDDLLNMIKNAQELETTYEAYETYLSVIGRDGLPYQLISQMIPTLQTEVNNILSQMVDFSVSLDVDGKNINGRIVYEDDRTWPLELASGMEKFISGLAIRVALMSVSNLPKSNFLVIDEGLGVLDADNLASMSTMFDILKTQFDFIILISHLDVVRDIADTLLEIRRDDGFSYITVE